MSTRSIPRWIVENDPTWEKSIDSDLGTLKWIKKGTDIQAICEATGIFCDVEGFQPEYNFAPGIPDILGVGISRLGSQEKHAALGDIVKYLSSRYLNPEINGPRPFSISRNTMHKHRKL